MKKEVIIIINPGSTSTKFAVYGREGEMKSWSAAHPGTELEGFKRIADQVDYRLGKILPDLQTYIIASGHRVVGLAARGGIVKPLEGGTYRINEAFIDDAASCRYGEHASNLGCLLAERLKAPFGLDECYTVDPVSTGNMWPKAKISGVPGIERAGRGHPLNMKMTAMKIAARQGIPFGESLYVVAHLGGGISIGVFEGGKMVDVNDALLGMGPFSPNRAGALPLRGVMDLCYSRSREDVTELLSRNSGLKAYLGTDDLRDVYGMVDEGNETARLICEAFVYQVAKEIGAYYAGTACRADAVIITGGMACNSRFVNDLKEYVGKLTAFHVYPGENEMQALAEGVFRVIDGKEEALEYD